MGESQSTIDTAALFRIAHRPVRPFRSIELFAGAGVNRPPKTRTAHHRRHP